MSLESTVLVDSLGHDLADNVVRIGGNVIHVLVALHSYLANLNHLDHLALLGDNLEELNIGLVIAPASIEDVTHLDSVGSFSLGSFGLGSSLLLVLSVGLDVLEDLLDILISSLDALEAVVLGWLLLLADEDHGSWLVGTAVVVVGNGVNAFWFNLNRVCWDVKLSSHSCSHIVLLNY